MRKHGAEVMACPHCGRGTPVFRSDYDRTGTPLSFTVCLWCEGYLEWNGYTGKAHKPYTGLKRVRTND